MSVSINDLKFPYIADIPEPLKDIAEAPSIQRLRQIGMNCGCEYTSFPVFQRPGSYHRFDHSLGVALIVWRFTHDLRQAAAGLLHDIATPVFAHVIGHVDPGQVAALAAHTRLRVERAVEDGEAHVGQADLVDVGVHEADVEGSGLVGLGTPLVVEVARGLLDDVEEGFYEVEAVPALEPHARPLPPRASGISKRALRAVPVAMVPA